MTSLLLVDDDEAFRQSVSGALEDAGFEVVHASHGEEALQVVAAEVVHAVVSDVNMPFMDGFTLCRTLREADSQLPILLLTSRDSEIDEVLGLDLGADDYMTKLF
ncbi:MAG: response regulator, partial [Polyangiales bacterium]